MVCREGIIDTQSHFAYHHWMLLLVVFVVVLVSFISFFYLFFSCRFVCSTIDIVAVILVCACLCIYLTVNLWCSHGIVHIFPRAISSFWFGVVDPSSNLISTEQRNCRYRIGLLNMLNKFSSTSVLACVQIKRCEFSHTNWKCFKCVLHTHNINITFI